MGSAWAVNCEATGNAREIQLLVASVDWTRVEIKSVSLACPQVGNGQIMITD